MPSALILVIAPEFNANINNQDDFCRIGKVRIANRESLMVESLTVESLTVALQVSPNRLQLNR